MNWSTIAVMLAAVLASGGVLSGEDEAQDAPAVQPVPSARKLPVPVVAAQERALAQIKDVFADEYQSATTPTQKQALALALFNQAAQTEKDAAARFVLLRQSQELALAAGDVDAALKAADATSKHFQIDLLADKVEVFKKAGRMAPASSAGELVKGIVPHIDEALAADRFDLARELLRVAISLSRSKRDPALNRELAQRTSKINEQEKQWDEAKKAAAKLKVLPADAASNHKLGTYRVFVKGDWETGLSLLAKGPFSPLRKAAELDLAQPSEPKLQIQLADAWWKLAETSPTGDKPRLTERAKLWYERALPELVDLEKVRVAKRLEKIAENAQAPGESRTKSGRDILDIALAPGLVQRFRLVPRAADATQRQDDRRDQARLRCHHRSDPSAVASGHRFESGAAKGERLPVETVNYQDCEQFIQRLNGARLGKFRFRFPTESEWEYAARAGASTKFYFGDDEKLLGQYEWFSANASSLIQPVGGLKPNRAGLYDMLGNIHEWCQGEVIRGGSAIGPVGYCVLDFREERLKMENNRNSHIGLRLFCDPQ